MKKTIRFLSKLPYIGKWGTKTSWDYWTVWEVKINWVYNPGETWIDGHWEEISAPKPVIFNFSMNDYKKYRGKLYDWYELSRGKLVENILTKCTNCNKDIYIEKDSEPICGYCEMADELHNG